MRDPYQRQSPVFRAAMHGAISAGLTHGVLSVAEHYTGHPSAAHGAAVGISGAFGAAGGARLARQNNREVDSYIAEHGTGQTRRSVVGRTLLHGWGGRLAGAATGTLHAMVAGHDPGSAEHLSLMAQHANVGGVIGMAHGFRSARKHNAMVDALAVARAHKPSVQHTLKNAQFEAKHRRIHGKFT